MKLPTEMMRASLRAAIALVRGGSDLDAAVALIEQVAAALAPSSAAVRKRNQRARERDTVTQMGVTCHATSHAESHASVPPYAPRAASESPSLPKSSEILGEEREEIPEERESAREKRHAEVTLPVTQKSRDKSRPWKRVPSSWQPTDEHRALAREHGKDFERELAVFRDHTFAAAKSDADATFRNWLRRDSRGFGAAGKPAPVRGAMAPVSKSFGSGRVDMEALLREREEAEHGRA